MSEQAAQVPLIELARAVPNDLCGEWQEIDGLRAWHHAPIGRYVHELCDQIAALTARAERLQAELVKAEGERDELREAIENAPCHDFCREAKSKHHIPYDQHHHACWKVAALQLEGQDYMRAAPGGLNG